MRVVISKWGNSPAIRLNKALMEEASLSLNQPVDIVVKAGHIEIRPVEKPDLAELISQITPENLHEATDWGKPVGKEVW
jgi:antitoxin MazE